MSDQENPATPSRVADVVMDVLHELGVTQGFMVTGGGAMHLNDAIRAHGGFDVVCTLHEQAAAIAADAYARQLGTPALCLVTTGPGGTNAITGVAGAWVDSVPMIVVSGQAKQTDLVGNSGLRQRGVQEIDIVSMVRGITKSAITMFDPNDVRREVERAWHLATTGRPGPVWLDIPLDVQGAPVVPAELPSFVPEPPDATHSDENLADTATAVLDMIAGARRPLLLLGAGVRLSRAQDDVLALAESLQVPVLSTWPAQGVVGDDHPLFVGRPGALAARGPNFALQGADLILCLGVRLDLATTGYDPKDFGRNARKVIVEIDSYEIAKLEGAVDVAIQADVGALVRAMRSELRTRSGPLWQDVEGWAVRCRTWRDRYPLVTDAHRVPGELISTYRLAEVICDVVVPEDILALCCSGLGIEIFILSLKLHTGQRAIFGNALGEMGAGPPTALGACLAGGRRRTICVDGDGGLQLNVQELQTISRLNLPIKLFVLANEGYASIRASQQRWFGHLIGADPSSGLTLPPLDGLAAAYGWTYRKLRGEDPLEDQITAVLETPGPVLCEVPTPPNEPREPVQTSEMLPDGRMRSLPIEDLAPRLSREELNENVLGSDGRFGSSEVESSTGLR